MTKTKTILTLILSTICIACDYVCPESSDTTLNVITTGTTGEIIEPTVFVTEQLYDGSFNGNNPDVLCTDLALLKGYTGKWYSWTSTDDILAKDKLSNVTSSFIMKNGIIFADSIQDVFTGNILSPLNTGLDGESIHSEVWTGTIFDGSLKTPNCKNWTSSSALDFGVFGNNGQKTSLWTDFETFKSCDTKLGLYCFKASE